MTHSCLDVPFNEPFVADGVVENVQDALASTHHSGDGPWTSAASDKLCALTGHSDAFLTTSGTHALELACMALDLGPGDEVIVPSFTFTSTATAPWRTGAKVRFADIDAHTLSLTPETVEPLLSPATRAVIAVHYAGIADRPDELARLLSARGVHLIEDNAHGLGGRWANRPLGTFGTFSAMSFHETKNLQCGEGGALGVNDNLFLTKCEAIREKGTNRSRFFRGEVDKYTWVATGSSFLPAEIVAAVLAAQLDSFPSTQARRLDVWNSYAKDLSGWADAREFALPMVPAPAEHPAHIFYLLAPDARSQAELIQHLRVAGIQAPFHYQPLHLSPAGRQASEGSNDSCPVSADVAARLLRLPLYPGLTPAQVAHVTDTVARFD